MPDSDGRLKMVEDYVCVCMCVPDSDDLFCVGLTYPEDPCPFVMLWRRRVSVLERGRGGGGGRERERELNDVQIYVS